MKVKFGSLITDGRGKIGGHVASKNRGGAYLRTKVTPVNPQTSYQSVARGRITTYSQGWRALTDTQRNAWNGAVANFQKTDIFGDLKNPSGLNLYVRLNSNIVMGGGTAILVPPLPGTVTAPLAVTLTGAAGTPALSIAWTGGAIPASTAWIARMTPQVSPGKSFVKSLFRNLATLPAADTTPTSVLTEYNARFGTLVAGQKVFVEILAVNLLTGIVSTPLSTFAIIAA